MNDRSQSCFDLRTETDFYENSVFRDYRSYLIFCGLWPYESFRLKQARRIVCLMGMVSIILVQIFVLFTRKITPYLLLDISPYLIIFVAELVKYVAVWTNYKDFQEILEHMRIDWSRLRKMEQARLKRTYEVSSCYCTLIVVVTLLFGAVCIATCLLPKIVVVITAANTSRPINQFIATEYFVDSEKYFIPISIHQGLTLLLGIAVHISTDSLNTVIQMHISGMFQIIGSLLMHMFDEPEIGGQKMDEALVHYERLLRIIDLHNRNLKLCDSYKSCMLIYGLIQMILAILGIASTLLKVRYLMSSVQDIPEIITYILLLCLCCFFTFFSLLPGQILYDASCDMLFKAYCGCWYTAPMKSKKLLLFLMLRLMTPCKLQVKNILSVTMETSSSLLRSGFSYFMVLRSVQQ